jgi:hypothetical protein
MKRFLMVLALGAGLIGSGCGDDDGDDDDVKDTGPRADASTDAGPARVDAGMDAARPDSGMDANTMPPPVVCGTVTCTPYMNALGTVYAAACAKNAAGADVCGLSSANLGGTDAGLPAALEKNAPGVASATCGAFYDALESPDGGTRGNGRIDTFVAATPTMLLPISYPGCCTAKGFCSGDTNMAKVTFNGTPTDTNAMFGCMESTAFFRNSPPSARAIACNPSTGALMFAPTDAGVDAGGGGTVTDAGGIDSGARDN